jgi:hypothetical protein
VNHSRRKARRTRSDRAAWRASGTPDYHALRAPPLLCTSLLAVTHTDFIGCGNPFGRKAHGAEPNPGSAVPAKTRRCFQRRTSWPEVPLRGRAGVFSPRGRGPNRASLGLKGKEAVRQEFLRLTSGLPPTGFRRTSASPWRLRELRRAATAAPQPATKPSANHAANRCGDRPYGNPAGNTRKLTVVPAMPAN